MSRLHERVYFKFYIELKKCNNNWRKIGKDNFSIAKFFNEEKKVQRFVKIYAM